MGRSGRRRTASKASSSARIAPRSCRRCSTGRAVQARFDRAPAADRRRADERARCGEARAPHGHPLLRTLRGAAQGLRRAALAARSGERRRADAVRPGGAPVEQDSHAGRTGVEGVSAGAPEARHDVRSDDDRLRRRPRRHAHAQRRLARALHAALADGLLHAQPRQPRIVFLRLDPRGRNRLAQLLSGVVPAVERLQEDGRPGHGQRRRGLHLQHLRLRQHSRDGAVARSRVPSRSK